MAEKDSIIIYTANDLVDIFRISKTQAYNPIHAYGFPPIRINNRYFVPEDALCKWINPIHRAKF